MIWLASYPRSGNTFIRNVLYEVYGLESSAFHLLPNRKVEEGYQQFPFVKTHLLPDQLVPDDHSVPVIYIVRDGRDAIVSQAYHHVDLIDPESNIVQIMEEAVFASKGTYFGGWAKNVHDWVLRADLVLRFEDIVKDPIAELDKIGTIMDLPEPNVNKLPSFKQLKFGNPKYGKPGEGKKLNKQFFRKGKSGTWKKEMPKWLYHYFWLYHGPVMSRMGYQADGTVNDRFDTGQIKKAINEMVTIYPEKLSFKDMARLKIIRRIRKTGWMK